MHGDNVTPSSKSALLIGLATFLAVAAFLRGNYLLGPGYAMAYVFILLMIFWLAGRASTRIQNVTVTLLLLAVGTAMAWPATFHPDVQISIDAHAQDRAVRAELTGLLKSDPAYHKVVISTIQRKVLNVTLSGSLKSRSDLDNLRRKILSDCPTMAKCWLDWGILIIENNEQVRGSDTLLFGNRK